MEEEFLEIHNNNLWRSNYSKICFESKSKEFAATEALKPENKPLNRYRDVYPYDHSRVVLQSPSPTNYINASLVTAEIGSLSRRYILTQGPLGGTVPHFWWMVWQEESRAVIMLNRVIEKGTVKCAQYWPQEGDRPIECPEVGLRVEWAGEQQTQDGAAVSGGHYATTTLRLVNTVTGEARQVTHFHYTNWPDFGVPSCPDTFLEFLGAVRESGTLEEDGGRPVVHCSAGIGRSGTFVLVDTCLLEAEKMGSQAVNIKERLLDMRTCRMGLIQTEDQLKFSYLSIIEGARQMKLISNVPELEQVPEVNSSSDESEDDVPPPLPPPRTESLKKESDALEALQNSVSADEMCQFNGIPSALPETLQQNGLLNSDLEDDLETEQVKPAVSNPGIKALATNENSTDNSPSKCILTNDKLEEKKRNLEIRRRKKGPENLIENKKEEIQAAIRKAEEWNSRREYIKETIFPFCVGLVMICAGVYLCRS